MSQKQAISCDGTTLTVRVPLTSRRHGGRKQVVTPDGATWATPKPQVDSTLVKAIARAQRWKRMLESGQFVSVNELAEAEKINQSYMCRVLRLTLLAPNIVEAILNGGQGPEVTLASLLEPFPGEWMAQWKQLCDQ